MLDLLYREIMHGENPSEDFFQFHSFEGDKKHSFVIKAYRDGSGVAGGVRPGEQGEGRRKGSAK